jgi:hypothetical protein
VADARRHHASREIVFIAVPFEGGSPKPERQVKPRYPKQVHQPAWRPRTKPPGKTKAVKRLIDAINHNDEVARAFMAEARRQAA